MHKLLALLLLAASLPAGAEIYKWTDAQGRVHFGDSAAGTGKPAEAITAPQPGNTYGNDADSRERSERQRRLSEALRIEEAEREKATRASVAERARRETQCQRMRQELQSIEGRVAYYTGANGERQFLDDSQRRAYVDDTTRKLKEHCP